MLNIDKKTRELKDDTMNFKINHEKKERFLTLCELAKKNATDIITEYIDKCIKDNAESIENYLTYKDKLSVKL